MESKESSREEVSSAQAVLVGALAPGVNAPTWNTLKMSFLMLGLCLAVMLGLAFSSSDLSLTLHVAFLFLITGTLFVLLSSCWGAGLLCLLFLAETGFVSVEHQMEEIGLAPRDEDKSEKTS